MLGPYLLLLGTLFAILAHFSMLLDLLWPILGQLWTPWEPIWAPLGTTWATLLTQGRIRASRSCHTGATGTQNVPLFGSVEQLFLKNAIPKQHQKHAHFLFQILARFGDPWALKMKVSLQREHDFHKTPYVQKSPTGVPRVPLFCSVKHLFLKNAIL